MTKEFQRTKERDVKERHPPPPLGVNRHENVDFLPDVFGIERFLPFWRSGAKWDEVKGNVDFCVDKAGAEELAVNERSFTSFTFLSF
jgi:hypothetical protein